MFHLSEDVRSFLFRAVCPVPVEDASELLWEFFNITRGPERLALGPQQRHDCSHVLTNDFSQSCRQQSIRSRDKPRQQNMMLEKETVRIIDHKGLDENLVVFGEKLVERVLKTSDFRVLGSNVVDVRLVFF